MSLQNSCAIPSDDQLIDHGHESKGSQMHHCWWGKFWVKTHDNEQIYCELILPRPLCSTYFQINAPLYCTTVFKGKICLKMPENRFFLTENWEWVLNLRNYQKKGPGLATDRCRLLFSSECKEIAMHHFFWDTLYYL